MQLRGYTERNSKNHLQSPIMIKWCLIESSQRLKNKKKSTTSLEVSINVQMVTLFGLSLFLKVKGFAECPRRSFCDFHQVIIKT